MGNQNNINETQVLNLQELEQVAKSEKEDNKHKFIPKILLIIGVLMIISGIILQVTQNDHDNTTGDTDADVVIPDPDIDIDDDNTLGDMDPNGEFTLLVCTKEETEDGMTTRKETNLNFSDGLLVSTQTNMILEIEEEELLQLAQLMINPVVQSLDAIDSMSVLLNIEENQLTLSIYINLATFDPESIDSEVVEELAMTFDFNFRETYESVRETMQNQGFVCH